MKKRAIILSFLLSVLLLFVACGSNDGAQDTTANPENQEYEKLTFDNYGREVNVTAKPQKVLTLGPNCSELFVALGLTDYIIGNSLDNHSRGALPEYEEDYAKIPELNYSSATRDAVLTSGADFIYGIDWEFGGSGLELEELTEFGITTYMNSATTLDEIYEEISHIGKIFQIEDRAQAFIEEQKSRIATVQDQVSEQEPVKVLVYDSGGDGVFTCSGTNFETLLVELAGGKNVFDDITEKQWITVSYEEVLARDPDVIVIHDYDTPSLEEKIKEIKNDPTLSKLDSVKNERFISISLESVLPGNRMAYTVEKLSKGFYPELFN
ncbi:ABC transporter substrate-binding protein [Alkalibaculum sp. M08DMB]|uniref:ABC transporter substrate-binding protein n=1 Tax=Alkalibaculum sporogenes TaxID=2655001 RepID=A0A6A7K801_9FIRM|nr:ABC transporter substrate-binding protein [Alkalibaculum sporogenes]MPW25560.1 ABC transporter substrate-binding protein [Alkalibaculum sporogenes]